MHSVLARRRKLFYGWWLLAAATLIMTVVSGFAIWSHGLYVRPMEREFGWSRAEVSLGFSAALLASGLAGPLIGLSIDRIGPRAVMLIGSVLSALTYALLASTQTLTQWYLFAAINAGFLQMTFFIPLMVLISRWFDKRRGIALSILGAGFSLGGFLILPLVALIIDLTDWRGGFLFSGVLVAAIVLPLVLLVLRDRPAEMRTYPDGAPPPEPRRSGPLRIAGLSPGHALRQPMFWVLAFALTFFFYGLVGWTVHLIPFFESRGISRATAALLISGSAGLGIFARLLIGSVADRFSRFELPSAVLTFALVLSMASLLLDSGWIGVALFVIFWLVGSSGVDLAESLNLTRAFGLAHFATLLGIVVVIETAGQVLSPSVAGWMFDETGSYDLALVMYTCTFAVSAGLFALAARMKRPFHEVRAE